MPNERINTGYAQLQLHLALATAADHHDQETRNRARDRADKWNNVIASIQSGRLDIGSRTPVTDAPKWLTLEVATGGFATGGLAAGGDLLPFEQELLAELDFQTTDADVVASGRKALNYFFISDVGFGQLIQRVQSGCYKIAYPEEGALLVAAWLSNQDLSGWSADLISELEPFFSKVRFYPQPSDTPQNDSNSVYLRDVKTVREDIRQITTPSDLLAQNEAIRIWQPFREKVFSFLIESCDANETPLLDPQHVEVERARTLVSEYQSLRKTYKRCNKPIRKDNLGQAIRILQNVAQSKRLSASQSSRLGVLCDRYISKRGIPGSDRHQEFEASQRKQIDQPLFTEIASVLLARLSKLAQNSGVEDYESVAAPVSTNESTDQVRQGVQLPQTLIRKLERCVSDSVSVLLEKKIIKSADSLAIVLPQITGNVRASGIADSSLRGLYAAIYQAFRRRRSLLLLNYQSQIRLEELPWINLIDQQRNELLSAKDAAFAAAQEIARLAVTHFPHAIVPNKLLQEFRAIAKSATVEVPFVDELAADIFMGGFTTKFVQSAKIAADLLKGSVYQAYYQIDFDEILAIEIPKQKRRGRWGGLTQVHVSPKFADICERRSPTARAGGSYVARNGTIIEQQQILTTQNLAAILTKFDLVETLKPSFIELAQNCFERVCGQLQIEDRKFHGRLIKLKNSAYTWRQMLVFLSLSTSAEIRAFGQWADEYLSCTPSAFQARFRPATNGLHHAIAASLDEIPVPQEHQMFLGWSIGEHWLLK